MHRGLAALLAVERLDVVHVCTPPRHHAPLALECLAADVNVLVEKPPALSLSEIDTLIAAEHGSAGRVATVFQHRFEVVTRWRAEQSTIVSGHRCQLAAFLDALDSGETPPVTLADTRNTMEFVAALYASAFTGTAVKAGQIGPDNPFYATMEGIGAPWANAR